MKQSRTWIVGRVLNRNERIGQPNGSAVLRLMQRVGKTGKEGRGSATSD